MAMQREQLIKVHFKQVHNPNKKFQDSLDIKRRISEAIQIIIEESSFKVDLILFENDPGEFTTWNGET